ncbi:DUF2784 family protein [Candidatus Parcubacteria bacterium]|nr:DUF2784 family protein [Candidatus Parcubacteria bacterium]
MNYEVLANLTAITHIVLVFAVLAGILISIRYKRFRPWEAAAVLIVIVFWSLYGNCPLTLVESHFRDLAGHSLPLLVQKGFLPYYINKFLSLNLPGPVIGRFTYFVGGIFFLASIEWLSPYINFEIFKLRRLLRKTPKRHLTRANRV